MNNIYQMDLDRKSRYLEKISFASTRCSQIEDWIEMYGSDGHMDLMPLLAIFKGYQEITECLMDIIAMHLRDIDLPARDDYSNIERITIFSVEERRVLSEMNGLRNRIIHRYNATDEEIALERITSFIPRIHALLDGIKAWMRQF